MYLQRKEELKLQSLNTNLSSGRAEDFNLGSLDYELGIPKIIWKWVAQNVFEKKGIKKKSNRAWQKQNLQKTYKKSYAQSNQFSLNFHAKNHCSFTGFSAGGQLAFTGEWNVLGWTN